MRFFMAQFSNHRWWALILWPAIFCDAFHDPCSAGNGLIGSDCDFNDDCLGFGVVCTLGKCRCHPDYVEKTDSTLNTKYCSKLPDRINSACTDSCKLPMFCNNGNCECIRSTAIKDICLADSVLGQSCNKNQECVVPFSSCIQNKCQCIEGTRQVGSSCQAELHCPTGAKPAGSCYLNVTSVAVIQNYANSGKKVDNCTTEGHYCYTDDVSGYGICCRAVCPLSQLPDPQFTCDLQVHNDRHSNRSNCPADSHYCHRAAGQSYSATVCCRKPCLEPNPVFIRGSCYTRALLNGPCLLDEQCDGGYSMECSDRNCRCKSGFLPYSDNFTISDDNPPQICVRSCATDEIAYNGECFKARVSLQDQCAINDQCPFGAVCKRGFCLCDCTKGFLPTQSNSACAAIVPSTIKPVPSITGTTSADLLSLIKTILGGSSAG